MLDRPDAEPDCSGDTVGSVSMGSDVAPAARRFVDDRRDLVVGELLIVDRIARRRNPARQEQFQMMCTLAQGLARRLAQRIGAIDEICKRPARGAAAKFGLFMRHSRVAMPAGLAKRTTTKEEAR